jgi:hypothetical protein
LIDGIIQEIPKNYEKKEELEQFLIAKQRSIFSTAAEDIPNVKDEVVKSVQELVSLDPIFGEWFGVAFINSHAH